MELKFHENMQMQTVWRNAYMNYNAPKVFDEKLQLTMYANVWMQCSAPKFNLAMKNAYNT